MRTAGTACSAIARASSASEQRPASELALGPLDASFHSIYLRAGGKLYQSPFPALLPRAYVGACFRVPC